MNFWHLLSIIQIFGCWWIYYVPGCLIAGVPVKLWCRPVVWWDVRAIRRVWMNCGILFRQRFHLSYNSFCWWQWKGWRMLVVHVLWWYLSPYVFIHIVRIGWTFVLTGLGRWQIRLYDRSLFGQGTWWEFEWGCRGFVGEKACWMFWVDLLVLERTQQGLLDRKLCVTWIIEKKLKLVQRGSGDDLEKLRIKTQFPISSWITLLWGHDS